MKISEFNDLLALIANLGVIAGIVFLAFEIRQNTEMMQAQMSQARSDLLLTTYRDRIHSDYWPSIAAKRREAASVQEWIDSLNPEEFERAWTDLLLQTNDVSNQFIQFQNGFLDSQVYYTATVAQIRRIIPSLHTFGGRGIFNTDFLDEIERIAIESGLEFNKYEYAGYSERGN